MEFPRAGSRRVGTGERYAVALLAAAFALAVQALLHRVAAGYFYPVFLAVVAFSAWYGGLGPGVVTAGAAAVGSAWLALEPPPSIDASPPGDWGDLAAYFASGVLVSGLIAFQLASRRRAERAAARTSRVHDLNLSLGPVLSPTEVAGLILRHVTEAVHAQGGAIALLAPDGVSLEVLHVDGTAAVARASAEGGPLGQAAREGVPVYLPKLAETDGRGGSLAALPFMPGGRSIGALELRFQHDRTFPEADRSFLSTLVGQGALALERARLYAAERDARERHAFLAEASSLLASSLDYRTTLAAVARLCVPRLADWCGVDVVEEDGRLRRVAVAHVDPARVESVWEMSRRYVERDDDPVPRVVKSGAPLMVSRIPETMLQAFARDPEHLARLRAMGLRSLLIVPMRARDRILGAIVFATAESRREYTEADRVLAEDLAGRAAVAVDNARLFGESARRCRPAASRSRCWTRSSSERRSDSAFVDDELRFVRINDALAALNWHPPGADLGRTVSEVLGSEGVVLAEECFRQVLESGEPILDREVRAERNDGTGQRFVALGELLPGPRHRRRGALRRGHRHRRHRAATGRRAAGAVPADGGDRQGRGRRGARSEQHDDRDHRLQRLSRGSHLHRRPRLEDIAEIRKAADRAAGITDNSSPTAASKSCSHGCWTSTAAPRHDDGNPAAPGPGRGPPPRPGRRLAHGAGRSRAVGACILDLAINARDAMDGSGELSIATGPVSLDEGYAQRYPDIRLPPGRYVRVTVSDTGQGMDADTGPGSSSPSSRPSRSGQEPDSASRLSTGIVKQSDGFIWVYGEAGHGAVFKIYLPEQSAVPTTTGEHAIPRDARPARSGFCWWRTRSPAANGRARSLVARLHRSRGRQWIGGPRSGGARIRRGRPGRHRRHHARGVGGRELGAAADGPAAAVWPVLFISGYTDG